MADFKKISDFKKSKLSRYPYQDPTYLSFVMLFDFTDNINSPLLSLGAENYLTKLANSDSTESEFYKERLENLQNFKKALKTINNEMPWYWQSLSGLEKLQQYNPENAYFGGDDSKIEITTLESLNLPIAGLMHLYKKAVFDERKWSWIIPSNLRKFRVYIYVSEVRKIKDNAMPRIGGLSTENFPDNFKPSLKVENKNKDISGTAGRPYFMLALKECEFDIASGTTIFADLQKAPTEPASGNIAFRYEVLYNVESRVLNGIISSEYGADNLAPAPDGEGDSPDSVGAWLLDKAKEKGEAFIDRAVGDLKNQGLEKMQELQAAAKDATVGRLDRNINNIYKEFITGVDNATDNISNNIKESIGENIHGATSGANTIGDALTTASKDSLGSVYDD